MNFSKIVLISGLLALGQYPQSALAEQLSKLSSKLDPKLQRIFVEAIAPAESSEVTSLAGGVIEGNGGEHITNEENPWFLGSEPVHYCIKRDPTVFSASAARTQSAIKEAFKTWQDFIKRGMPDPLKTPFLLAKSEAMSLTLDFIEVTCEEEHELEFQLGVKDAYLNEALEFSAKSIIALSFREAYSDKTGRAKGRIWLASDYGDQAYRGPNPGPGFWGKNSYLTNTLIHELGHVFGFRHMESGFMAAYFPAKMLEFGLDEQITRDSIGNDFFMCGQLMQRDLLHDVPPLAKIFDLKIEDLASVCFERIAPLEKYGSNPFMNDKGPYKLVFRLKDGSQKSFDGDMSSTRGKILSLRGQFLVEDQGQKSHYSNFAFMNFRGPYSSKGTLNTPVGNLFITAQSTYPSTLEFSLGYDGKWYDFLLAKFTPEVIGMSILEESGFNLVP